MNEFIERHRKSIVGVLNGYDRLRFRGTLRLLAFESGVKRFLWRADVLLKDFKSYVNGVTNEVRQTTEDMVQQAGRGRVRYLNRTKISKEDFARQIAEQDRISEGLICVLSCIEPCRSIEVRRNRELKRLQIHCTQRQCLHYYFYLLHPVFGFMHVRLQTWFPFTLHVCVNGREWLARLLDQAGIGYVRRENCFVHVEDIPAAQALFNQQLRVNWQQQLQELTDRCHPCHSSITACWPKVNYYWSVDESEWASDVMFRSQQALAQLYPRLIRHGICTFSSPDAMRFLGRKVPNHGHVRGSFQGEVISDLKHRPEGLRVKHRVAGNSIKMYDKQGSVLRIETTVNDPHDFRVYREKENDHSGRQDWHILRKGIADLHRRAQVSQAANERYLNALATVEDTQSVGELARDVCQRVNSKGRRARALNPLSDEDAPLLQAVARGEFAINGFRNRDLRVLLYGSQADSDKQRRSDAGKITRKLQLLKAHQLIRRVNGTHRYLLTKRGQTVITALLAVRDASTKILTQAA
jgi:hypothetical protein